MGADLEDTDGSSPAIGRDIETEVKELMGLFDLPAFARRGQELECSVRRIHDRCRTARTPMLEMACLRLGQWCSAVTGPADWCGVFATSIEPLWPLAGAEPPRWSGALGPLRRRFAIARDLRAAVVRFNRRWLHFLEHLNLEPTNSVIGDYNRYYVLEKECVLGSARLAARFFNPGSKLTKDGLLYDHPTLPVPELATNSTRPQRP
jgi:hypothetical protein